MLQADGQMEETLSKHISQMEIFTQNINKMDQMDHGQEFWMKS